MIHSSDLINLIYSVVLVKLSEIRFFEFNTAQQYIESIHSRQDKEKAKTKLVIRVS